MKLSIPNRSFSFHFLAENRDFGARRGLRAGAVKCRPSCRVASHRTLLRAIPVMPVTVRLVLLVSSADRPMVQWSEAVKTIRTSLSGSLGGQ